eukprot:SAG31_NODE_1018_length_10354_cov_10.995514_3_plen_92_part_00
MRSYLKLGHIRQNNCGLCRVAVKLPSISMIIPGTQMVVANDAVAGIHDCEACGQSKQAPVVKVSLSRKPPEMQPKSRFRILWALLLDVVRC